MHNELSIIMVPTTKCNLSCLHCFEKHSDRVMSRKELRVVMQQVYDFTARHNIDGVTFYWQGGEVLLLGPDWFANMAETAAEIFSDRGSCVRHRLQSNLISYNARWRPIIRDVFQNSIGSSLDYPNLYRGFKSLTGDRFNDIWLQYCERARADGIDVSVISVINEQSLKMPTDSFLNYYCDYAGITNLQLNFPFELRTRGDKQQSYFLPPSSLGNFLVELFNTWTDENASWFKKIRINPFCELIDVFSFAPQYSRCNCIWSGNCADSFFSIGPDSAVGLCDCWVTSLPDFSFGNLQIQTLDEISRSEKRGRLRGRIDSILASECGDCPFLGICFGGCIIRTYGSSGKIERKDPYCEAYKALFARVQEHVRSTKKSGENHGQAEKTGLSLSARP